jgi:hypothetical protein
MKNLFKLVLVAIMGVLFAISGVNAQSVSNMNGNGDTITNTGTKYNTLKIGETANAFITIQANITKLSGTVGGTISIEGSLDGTNYVALDSVLFVNSIPSQTATNTTGVKGYVFNISDNTYQFIRVKYVGTGTMSAKMSSLLLLRKK